jgi:glycosyltransferase involved in cell wall biosynthesis
MQISVVIPSYCAQDHIYACLQSIAKQCDSESEVIVVDCSPDDQVEDICRQFPIVKFIKSVKRFNPGEGRNIGANNSSGKYLVFIDADVVLGANALANIKSHLNNGMDVFGAALELNKEVNNDFAACIEHYYFNHESQCSRAIYKRKNLSSAFMIINKEIFCRFGGFSDIPRMQDTELTERLIKSGVDLYFAPDVVGYQIQDSPLNKVLKKISITGNNLFFIRYSKRYQNFPYNFLLFVLLPFIMLAKITRINARNIRYSFSLPMIFVYSPFMYVCGMYWMVGFYRGLLVNNGVDSGR